MTDFPDIQFNIIVLFKFLKSSVAVKFSIQNICIYCFSDNRSRDAFFKVQTNEKWSSSQKFALPSNTAASGIRAHRCPCIHTEFRVRFLQPEARVLTRPVPSDTGKSHTERSINIPLICREKLGGPDPSYHCANDTSQILDGYLFTSLPPFTYSFLFISFSFLSLFYCLLRKLRYVVWRCKVTNLADSRHIFIRM
jgi:hypothetical protein